MAKVLRVAAYGVLLFFTATTGVLVLLRVMDPPITGVQLQRRIEAALTGDPYQRRYQPLPLQQISSHLGHAVVAAEDTRFFHHAGVDTAELEKVLEQSRRRGHILRGGSTITQQLVKNLFFTTRLAWLRKPFEIPLALLADWVIPKQRILELYLNVVEWGPGVFGAEAAARYHYGIPAAALSRDQAARLAACLPAPRRRHPERMERYAAIITQRMQRMGW